MRAASHLRQSAASERGAVGSMVSQEDIELLQDFRVESLEHLVEIEPLVLEIEAAEDVPGMRSGFRSNRLPG